MSKSSILTTSRNEPKNSASNSEPWLRKSNPKLLAFVANNSMRPTGHLAEISVIVSAVEIETIDLEENINETIDRKAETDKKAEIAPKAIGQEEIDPIRIDPHFVAVTATKDPLIDPKVIVPLTEATTAEIVPPIEAAVTVPVVETGRLTVATATDHKETVRLTEATTAEIVPPIEVAAVTDPVVVVDSGPAAAVDVPAAVDSAQAVAADAQVAAVDSDPAVAAEGLLAETNPKVTKPKLSKPKVTKPKESI